MELYNGDCLEIMKDLSNNSVDIIIADLPFGKLKHIEWDKKIDFEKLWEQIWRICKPNTPIFLFADFKFAVEIYNSQPKYFKYEIVWDKLRTITPLSSRKSFGRCIEYILVFYKNQPVYNYAKYHKMTKIIKKTNKKSKEKPLTSEFGTWNCPRHRNIYEPTLPLNIIHCKPKSRNKTIKKLTEKPQFVLEHLLKYFSNEGNTCLDFCCGSGSMGVACNKLKRKFIGIEKNKEFYEITKKRLENLNI